jgi:hypothetical protein
MFSNDTIVLPDADASLDGSVLGGSPCRSVRYLHFSSTSSVIVSPASRLTDRSVSRCATTTATPISATSNEPRRRRTSAGACFEPGATLLNAGYARGYESLRLITVERLDQVGADIGSAGIRADRAAMTSVHATWSSNEDGGTRVGTLFLTLVQRLIPFVHFRGQRRPRKDAAGPRPRFCERIRGARDLM